MFDLKRPCVNCPFRKGQGERFQLPLGRLEDIKTGAAFQCHKTVDYDHFDDTRARQGSKPQQCAGLIAVLQREGCETQIMQVAGRFGVDLSGMDPRNEAYASWADVIEAHSKTRRLKNEQT